MSKWISLLCSAGLVAAQVQPVHHAGARLITVDVLARNDKGAVKGLSKEDFTLMDKGKNQPIAVFSITDAAGASGAKTEPLPENVASNRMNKSGEVARTATVILFDRLNIPFSYDLATVRSKTLEMLGSLRPTDRVGFYSLGTTLKMVQDFDQAPVKIVESAKRLSDGGTGSDAGARELDAAITDALMPIEQQSTLVRSNGTQRALRTIARHLAGIPGRKNLIWILSSPPLDYDDVENRRLGYDAQVARLAGIMSEANIAVYPISIDPQRATQLLSATILNDAGAGGTASNATTAVKSASNRQASMGTFDAIAEATGGISFHDTKDLAGDVRKVVAEAEVTYMLGFYVDDKGLDGKSHDLSVKLAKRPETGGAIVRYKRSYLASRPPHPSITDLVQDSFDATEVGVMAATAPDPAKPGTNVVQVRVDLGDIQFEHRDDKWVAAVDLGMALEGPNGRTSTAATVTTNLNLSDEQLQKGLTAGLIIDSVAPAPSQPSHLRVVVQDKASGAAGSVRVPISPK